MMKIKNLNTGTLIRRFYGKTTNLRRKYAIIGLAFLATCFLALKSNAFDPDESTFGHSFITTGVTQAPGSAITLV